MKIIVITGASDGIGAEMARQGPAGASGLKEDDAMGVATCARASSGPARRTV